MTLKKMDDIFNDCLELIRQGYSLDECLTRFHEQRAELSKLLAIALEVKKVVACPVDNEFKEELKIKLLANMAQHRNVVRLRWWSGLKTRSAIAVISVVMVISAGGGSVAYAASVAMPDSPLYQIKLSEEQLLTRLAPSPEARVSLVAAFTDRRVNEIVYLAKRGDAIGISRISEYLDMHLELLASGISFTTTNTTTTNTQTSPETAGVTLPPSSVNGTNIGESNNELQQILSQHQANLNSQLNGAIVNASPGVKTALEQAMAAANAAYVQAEQSVR